MADTKSLRERGVQMQFNAAQAFKAKAASALSPNRLLTMDASGNVEHSAGNSVQVVGGSGEVATGALYPVWVLSGFQNLEAGAPVEAGQRLKADLNGLAIPVVDSDTSGDLLVTSAVGGAFANQPAGDAIEIVSSSAADTTQSITLYFTADSVADTVQSETHTLTGTTQVVTTETSIDLLLGAELSAATAGNITIREASANQTITTITAGGLTAGLENVTEYALGSVPTLTASGATTKQFGLVGTNMAGTAIDDSQALTGATAATMNTAFRTITKLLTGDLENSVTVDVKVGAVDSTEVICAVALENQATVGDTFYARVY